MQVRASKIRYRGTRATQEDVVAFAETAAGSGGGPGLVAVLSDGIGGLDNGRQASEIVNTVMLRESKARLDGLGEAAPPRILALLEEAARAANEALAAYRRRHAAGRCGATLLTCFLREGLLCYLSVGDSLLFGLAADGRLQQINRPQRVREGTKTYLASALLGEEIGAREARWLDLAGYRALLISSDGLPDEEVEACSAILSGPGTAKLKDIVARVQGRAGSRQDNLGMILLELSAEPLQAAPGRS